MVANGSIIAVLGTVRLPVLLKGEEILVEGIASDHDAEMLLGIDRLDAYAAIWDMKRGELFMHGQVFSLKPKIDGGWVRRVVVRELVQLPARCEANVAGYTVYRDLSST